MKKNILLLLITLSYFSCNKSPENYYNYEALLTKDKAVRRNDDHFEFVWKTKDSLWIYSQCWQPKDKPKATVCLLHGHGEHSGRYIHMAKFLTDSGFAVAAFDLRGHGKSQGQRGYFPGYKTLLGDITLFFKEVKKHVAKAPFFLYGQSLGGNLAINYTLRYEPRIEGTIASAPMLRTAFKPPIWKTLLGKTMYTIWPTLSLSSGVDLYSLSRDTTVVHSRLNDTLCHDRLTPRFIAAFKAGEWALRNTERLDIPLLLMHGDADRITSFQASCDFVQNAGSLCTLKVWEGYYHALHEEIDKEAIFAYVVKWINAQLTTRQAHL